MALQGLFDELGLVLHFGQLIKLVVQEPLISVYFLLDLLALLMHSVYARSKGLVCVGGVRVLEVWLAHQEHVLELNVVEEVDECILLLTFHQRGEVAVLELQKFMQVDIVVLLYRAVIDSRQVKELFEGIGGEVYVLVLLVSFLYEEEVEVFALDLLLFLGRVSLVFERQTLILHLRIRAFIKEGRHFGESRE